MVNTAPDSKANEMGRDSHPICSCSGAYLVDDNLAKQ